MNIKRIIFYPIKILILINNYLAKAISIVFKKKIGFLIHLSLLQYVFAEGLKKLAPFINNLYSKVYIDSTTAKMLETKIKNNIFDPAIWTNIYFLSYVLPFIILFILCIILPILLTLKAFSTNKLQSKQNT